MSTRSETVTRIVVDCDLCDRTNIGGYCYEVTGDQHIRHFCSDCYHDLTEPNKGEAP